MIGVFVAAHLGGRERIMSYALLLAVLAAQSVVLPAVAQQWDSSSPQRPPVEAPAKLFVRQSPNILEGTRLTFEYRPESQGYVAGCLQRDAEYLFAPGGVPLELQGSQSQEIAIYGFRAQFFGGYFTKAFVDTDGFVTFGDIGDSSGTRDAAESPRIAAFLTGDVPGLVAGPESSVEAKLEGGSLVISYTAMRPFDSPQASLSFQIVLDGASGDVSITYGRMSFPDDRITWLTGLSPGSEVRSRTTEIFSQECESENRPSLPTSLQQQDGSSASRTPHHDGEDDDDDSGDDGATAQRGPEDAQGSPNSSRRTKTGTGGDGYREEGDGLIVSVGAPADPFTAAMYGVIAATGGSFALLLVCCCCFCALGHYRPWRQYERSRPQDSRQHEAAIAMPPTAPAEVGIMVPAAGDNQLQTTASAASWPPQGHRVQQHEHHQAPPPPDASAPPLPESERHHRVYFPADAEGGRGAACATDSLSISVITASSDDQSSFGAKDCESGWKEAIGDKDEDATQQCVWCLDNPATHCFIPCGHRCVCQEHAELLSSSSSSNGRRSRDNAGGGTEMRGCCPICRQPIQGSLRIYV